jgi:hypothetical protein
MHRVELSPKEQRELTAVTAEFVKRPLPIQGQCVGCGRGIPTGYVPVVTRWGSTQRGGMALQVALDMLCLNCGEKVKTGGKVVRKQRVLEPQRAVPAPEASQPTLTAKDIALRLYGAASAKPRGSHWLAAKANLEYGDHILIILRKLRDAGKMRYADGRWSLWELE